MRKERQPWGSTGRKSYVFSAIWRLVENFFAAFRFCWFPKKGRAKEIGSVYSRIDSRTLAERRRFRSAPAADRRTSALESAAAVGRAVRSAQLAHGERTAQRHVGPVAVEQAGRTRVHQVTAAAARRWTAASACTLGARTLFFDCWRRGLDRGSAASSSTS